MINTSSCPVELIYERGYNYMDVIKKKHGTRAPEKDFLTITYKSSSITIRPYHKSIDIVGNITEIALGVTLLMQDTWGTVKNDIIDEVFAFKDGMIIGKIIVAENADRVAEFVSEYNRIFPTVALLK